MNLQLSLKREWFDMTDPNGKTEDYREITPYWCSRFFQYKGMNIRRANFCSLMKLNNHDFIINFYKENYDFKPFTTNTMTLGYPSKTDRSRFKIFEHNGIEIGYGKPEWGAPTDRMVFIIKHGKQIEA